MSAMGIRKESKGLEAWGLRSLERVWFYRNPDGQVASTEGGACHEQGTTHGISSVDIHKLVEDAENTTDTADEGEVSGHKGRLDAVVGLGHKVVASRVNE